MYFLYKTDCQENEEYSMLGTCEESCYRTSPRKNCEKRIVPKCVCKPGYARVKSKDKELVKNICVPLSECGSYFSEYIIFPTFVKMFVFIIWFYYKRMLSVEYTCFFLFFFFRFCTLKRYKRWQLQFWCARVLTQNLVSTSINAYRIIEK